jgi:hypothetical protein
VKSAPAAAVTAPLASIAAKSGVLDISHSSATSAPSSVVTRVQRITASGSGSPLATPCWNGPVGAGPPSRPSGPESAPPSSSGSCPPSTGVASTSSHPIATATPSTPAPRSALRREIFMAAKVCEAAHESATGSQHRPSTRDLERTRQRPESVTTISVVIAPRAITIDQAQTSSARELIAATVDRAAAGERDEIETTLVPAQPARSTR